MATTVTAKVLSNEVGESIPPHTAHVGHLVLTYNSASLMVKHIQGSKRFITNLEG